MPERYRIGENGTVVEQLRIPAKESLPPYEAVRSEDIIAVLRDRFDVREMVLYGAILLPLFNGFAQNYDPDVLEDQAFLHIMWQLDRWLIETGQVEANFMKAILAPRA